MQQQATNKAQKTNWTASPTSSVVFLLLFVFAFFPHLFINALGLPFALLFGPHTPSSRQSAPTPSSVCSCVCQHTTAAAVSALPASAINNGAAPGSVVPAATTAMSWFQKTISLPSRSRGSYLVTDEITAALPELKSYKVGILHLFVQHTSCALSMNENWDTDVREDMSDAMERIVPYDKKGNLYRHSAEGEDDMPAHIKSALIGSSVTIPISNGRLATGTWQGIWYLEFRASKHSRKVVATIQGEKA